jgi:hypothetical protein
MGEDQQNLFTHALVSNIVMVMAMAAVFIQSLNSNVKWQRHEPAGPEYPSKETIKKAIRRCGDNRTRIGENIQVETGLQIQHAHDDRFGDKPENTQAQGAEQHKIAITSRVGFFREVIHDKQHKGDQNRQTDGEGDTFKIIDIHAKICRITRINRNRGRY